MDYNQLRAFVAVAETRSFTRAAKQLFLTQPAISKRISALEQQLGRELIHREGHDILLTEAGEVLLQHAYQILGELDAAKQALDNLSGRVSGQLTLAASHHIGLHYLPTLIEGFLISFPDVNVDVSFSSSEEVREWVLNRRVQLGLITLDEEEHQDLEHHTVWHERLYPAAPLNQGNWARVYRELPAILPDRRNATRRSIDLQLQANGITPSRIIEVNHFEVTRALIESGLGWGYLPEKLACACHTSVSGFSRPLGLIHHQKTALHQAARAFVQCLPSDALEDD